MEETKKVNLASGNDYREGYINIDNLSMFPDAKVDMNADVLTLEYPENSVDEILLSHFIMYTRPEELQPLLIKWRRWLKEGGILKIETINLDEVRNHWTEKELLIPLFGKSNVAPHRWAWRFISLSRILNDVGFSNLEQVIAEKNPVRDFRIIATK